MNVKSVEKKEKSIVDIAVELGPEEFDAEVESVYRKMKGRIAVPGFRKGKVPRKMVENMYGHMYFYQDAVEACCPKFASEAVANESLRVVGQYTYDAFDFPEAGGFTFTVSVPVYPEVTLGQYKGLTAYKAPVDIASDAIDKEIESMRERNARLLTVERPVALNDNVILDYEGFCDDVAFSGGKGEKQSLTIGSGMFVPGFEEQLIGHKAGDQFSISIKFPEEYGNEELAGRDARFEILIHEVKEKQLPELDDEFAKDVSEFDTLDALRQSVREKLQTSAQSESDRLFRSELLKQAALAITADIPEAMFENRLDQIVNRYAMDMQNQGIPFEQFLQYMNTTAEQFRERFRENAIEQVKTDLALEKIADTEAVEVTDEEIDKEYENLAQMYQMKEEDVRARLPRQSVIADLRFEKAAKLIEESAIATDVKPAEPEQEEQDPIQEDSAEESPAKEAPSEE